MNFLQDKELIKSITAYIKDYLLPGFPEALRIEREYLSPALSVGIPIPNAKSKFVNLEVQSSLVFDNQWRSDVYILDKILSTFRFIE